MTPSSPSGAAEEKKKDSVKVDSTAAAEDGVRDDKEKENDKVGGDVKEEVVAGGGGGGSGSGSGNKKKKSKAEKVGGVFLSFFFSSPFLDIPCANLVSRC